MTEPQSAAERLRLALDRHEEQKQSVSGDKTPISANLQEIEELHERLQQCTQLERRRLLDSAGLRHISAAPPPITPVRGTGAAVFSTRANTPPDWDLWCAMHQWELWQAIALSCNIDPLNVEFLSHGWMGESSNWPSIDFQKSGFTKEAEQQYTKRYMLLLDACQHPPFNNKGSTARGHTHRIEAAVFVEWANAMPIFNGMPAEMQCVKQTVRLATVVLPAPITWQGDTHQSGPEMTQEETEEAAAWIDAANKAEGAGMAEKQNWRPKQPERFSVYGPALYRVLFAEWQKGRLRRPTAREVLEMWSIAKPPEVFEVMQDGFKHLDSTGYPKEVSVRALKEAINRMTETHD